jgi:uncharacterized membrane protein
METRFSSDLPTWAIAATALLCLANLAFLVRELQRSQRLWVLVSGFSATLALALAVLRPIRVSSRETIVPPKVWVLADTSRSMALPDGSETRHDARNRALDALRAQGTRARFDFVRFGAGVLGPLSQDAPDRDGKSDLGLALRGVLDSAEERPEALVVVSDGRLDDGEGAITAARDLGLPVFAVATTKRAPRDASIRKVLAAGAAVAHVPLPLHITVGCDGGLACKELTVSVRELREDGPPAVLGSGLAHLTNGEGTVDLTVTLDRAGARLLEVAIAAPEGDEVLENNTRYVPFVVARERVRVLHVAGRATSDVRSLRRWLKSNASVDVVAFFILRTPSDNPQAPAEDLALIPFPVDELFREHLPSFDAVVLQDFDAQPYGLERHLPAIAQYVRRGGGLIMVGGPNSFVAGGYAGTALASVLPVELDGSRGATSADTGTFVPQWTDEGAEAPLLRPLRDVLGESLPPMPGANVLGNVTPTGVTLWSHTSRTIERGIKMPVLAIGDQGDGRSIALGVDGSWLLEFSALGTRTQGRGYAALWDGLLGWLMHDPRFEPAQVDLPQGCVAGLPSALRVKALPKHFRGKVQVEVKRIDGKNAAPTRLEVERGQSDALDIPLPALPSGGYVARVRLGTGPTTRRDFACEAGGDEWADTRPDLDRLRRLADETKGSFYYVDSVQEMALPKPAVISTERNVVPVAPAWAWAALGAVLLGVHWFIRRRSGLL